MKTIKINNEQYSLLKLYEAIYTDFITKCDENSAILMESVGGPEKKVELLEDFINELTKYGLNFIVKEALMEGTLHLNLSPILMMESAIKNGLKKEELGQLVPEFLKKSAENGDFVTEDVINEAMTNSLVGLLKRAASMKGIEGIKKTVITMVMAGKLATMSTAAIASAAESAGMEPIEAQHLKVEVDAARKTPQPKENNNDEKKEKLAILEGSYIETPEGEKHPFKYSGSYDSFETLNKDNYPEYIPGTKEYEIRKRAFESGTPVKGTCYFKTTGGVKKFMGEFVEANGLWYRYTQSDEPKKPNTTSFTTDDNPDPIKGGNSDNSTFYAKERATMKVDDFSGLFKGAKEHWDYLGRVGKRPQLTFPQFVTDFLKRNDDRLSHLSSEDIKNLFKGGFKINLETIPPKQ
jgi:hypothetical protein